jgi:DNA (cytosine-5)-methyltransferase 1
VGRTCKDLTSNFPFEASDNKIHPSQNRVLSTYEALVIQTIAEYPYRWIQDGKEASRTLVAHVIGESVPPRLIDLVVRKIIGITTGTVRRTEQLRLFA